MKPRVYTSTGIVLSKRNLGEADKIITIFSKDFGKISLVAKGVRRPKSRKRGAVEIFSYIKFQGVDGKSMDILTEAVVIDDFLEIRKSLKKITLSYYFCEVTSKITNDNETNFEVFNLLLESLRSLKKQKLLRDLRMKFIHELLTITGYHPLGEKLIDHDKALMTVVERDINSQRVGKRMLSGT